MRHCLAITAFAATAFLIVLPPPAAPAENEAVSLDEICRNTGCRSPGTFTLRTKEGEQEIEQPGLPYVYKEQVIVLPGDEFDIEIDFAEDGKTGRVSTPGEEPREDHTIHVRFSQMDDNDGMMLSLRNGTDATIKYDAIVQLPDGRHGPTSSCPVRAGLAAFEMWPYPIRQLLLTNFRKLSESDKMVCN